MNNSAKDISILTYSEYLPPVSSFITFRSFSEIIIDGEEQFQKSTTRNRCCIAGANGKILLTIPLIGGRGVKSKSREVKINYAEPWQLHHWRSIQSCYGKSSFFHFYEERFQPFYEKRFEFLIDFNIQLLQVCFEILHWEKKIRVTNEFHLEGGNMISNFKSQISNSLRYHQVFEERNGFFSGLSIVDLIFNVGHEAINFL